MGPGLLQQFYAQVQGLVGHAGALVSAGRHDEAIALLDQEIAVSVNAADKIFIRCFRAFIQTASGRLDLVEPAEQLLAELSPDDHVLLGYMAYTLGRMGKIVEAERILADLEARAEHSYVSPTALFYASLGLNNDDRSFRWLNQSVDENVYLVLHTLRTSPVVDPLRDDPRFDAALDRIGLLRDI